MGCILCTYSNRSNNFSNHFKLRNMNNLLGTYALAYYRDAFIFGIIGLFLYKYLTYNPYKKRTSPDIFNLKYWVNNNWFDILGGFVFFFIWIRFKNEILSAFPQSPIVVWLQAFTDSFFIHLMFGVLSTHIIRVLRKKIRKVEV